MTVSPLRWLVAILLAVLAPTAMLRAQDRTGQVNLQRGDASIAQVEWRAFAAPDRKGGFGFLELRAISRTAAVEYVSVTIAGARSLRDPIRIELAAEPGQAQRITRKIPAVGNYLMLEFRAASTGDVQRATCNAPGHNSVSVLFIGSRNSRADEWKRAYERLLNDGRTGRQGFAVDLMTISPQDLPEDWRAISAMDLVVFDGEDGAESRAQRTVHDYALAGGTVVLLEGDGFATGALDPRGRSDRFGFGRVLALTKAESRSARIGDSRAVSSRLLDLLGRRELGPMAKIDADIATPTPAFFGSALTITGTEPPPMQFVLVLIGAFALLVGPINSFLCRDRRGWLLVTVPVAGTITTLGILAWGLLGQGLGTREAEQSFSILDQERGIVSTLAQRSLFAGSAAADLTPRARTWLWNLDMSRSRESAARWIEEAEGRIDGSLIPSRTITNLAIASVDETQSGLRIRREGDGFSIDTASDIEPIGDRLLLRLPDGRYLASRSGRLEPIDEGDAERRLLEWERELADFGPRRPRRFEEVLTPRPRSLLGIQREDLDGESLPRGSYFAVVKQAPGRDDLGLVADASTSSHAVLGFLGQKDIRD